MAELTPLSGIAESLIAKIASSDIQQASLHIGVYHDLQVLKGSLLSIKDVLLVADQMQKQNQEQQDWRRMLKHVLSDAENVFDEFECERLRNQVVNAHGNVSAITKVARFFSTSNPLVFRPRMAKQINELKGRLNNAHVSALRMKRFGMIDVGENSIMGRIPSFSFPYNNETIIKLLMPQSPCHLPRESDISPALILSYHHMPSHLKQCYELFSLYPKGFVFHSSEVASLWAALGLLPSPNKDETLIDVANQCLHELMSRSFLHEFVNFGTSYYFQIHDMANDLARSIAKDECLMINSNNQDIPQNVQHLSFAENDLLAKSFTPKSVDVRTIIFPIEGVGASSEPFLNMCVSRYKYLRILDMSDSTYETLPWSIGKLRHLRFLSLERNGKIKRVPDSICKLQNLQVLNLVGCIELKKLPKGLRNLINLRQLGITTKESVLPENDIASMNSLEILNIESCGILESFFVKVKPPSLRTLTIANCGSLKSLPLDINHFPQLETLLLDNCGYLELSKGYDDLNSNLRLKAIHLHSLPQLLTLPSWLQESTNTLQSLIIVDCKNLEVFPEWISTFSFLGSFCMINCPKLMFLPNDIHCLTALGYFRIEGCPELCRKCQPQVGEYWPKISPIKQIIIDEPEDLKEEPVL